MLQRVDKRYATRESSVAQNAHAHWHLRTGTVSVRIQYPTVHLFSSTCMIIYLPLFFRPIELRNAVGKNISSALFLKPFRQLLISPYWIDTFSYSGRLSPVFSLYSYAFIFSLYKLFNSFVESLRKVSWSHPPIPLRVIRPAVKCAESKV